MPVSLLFFRTFLQNSYYHSGASFLFSLPGSLLFISMHIIIIPRRFGEAIYNPPRHLDWDMRIALSDFNY